MQIFLNRFSSKRLVCHWIFKVIKKAGLFLVLLFCSKVQGAVVVGGADGEIIYRGDDVVKVYPGITGQKDGFYRELIILNGKPALSVGLRHDSYYTLSFESGNVSIDCAYHDERNKYNGARLTAGICGLGKYLEESYAHVAQSYSDRWWLKMFSFDTSVVYKQGQVADFFLGEIGGVNIYDRYSSAESLENAAPEKVLKGSGGCFYFGDHTIYLTFLDEEHPRLKYLDVLVSQSPMVFKRLDERDLIELAVNRCK